MLTSIGRAAARRIGVPYKLKGSIVNVLAPRNSLPAPVIAIRSFTSSRWSLEAASSGTTKRAKSSSTAKKPRATKTKKSTAGSTKRRATVKSSTKKSTASGRKTTAAKKPGRKRKESTPEDERKAKILQLKKRAMIRQQPSAVSTSAWVTFLYEELAAKRAKCSSFKEAMSEIKEQFANLSSAERERLQTKAKARAEAAVEARKAWVRSLPVEDVYLINQARRALGRLTKTPPHILEDERLPKRPDSGYVAFMKDRRASGAHADASVTEKLIYIARDWAKLNEAEKQSYRDASKPRHDAFEDQMNVIRARAKQTLSERRAADEAAKNAAKKAAADRQREKREQKKAV